MTKDTYLKMVIHFNAKKMRKIQRKMEDRTGTRCPLELMLLQPFALSLNARKIQLSSVVIWLSLPLWDLYGLVNNILVVAETILLDITQMWILSGSDGIVFPRAFYLMEHCCETVLQLLHSISPNRFFLLDIFPSFLHDRFIASFIVLFHFAMCCKILKKFLCFSQECTKPWMFF